MQKELKYPQGIVWLIGQCMEAKGKQDLWNQTRPEAMKALREMAIIQSAESSNRIEGVEVEKNRLVPLLTGKVKPQDRPEEEVLGYKNALAWIHKNFEKIEINSATILKVHHLCQEGASGDAGKFKTKNNEIIEIHHNGKRSIRFVPTGANETPEAINQLCLKYRQEIQNNEGPDLGIISNFVLDFLCIHPFRDGNGRTSRLLTILLLYQNGYYVGRYISLERIIEEHKDDYYSALHKSSQKWHEKKHDAFTWMMFFISTLRQAYNDLADKVQLAPDHSFSGAKSDIVKNIILEQISDFSLADIEHLCPSISTQLIKKVFAQLKKDGVIELEGRGRGSRWNKIKS